MDDVIPFYVRFVNDVIHSEHVPLAARGSVVVPVPKKAQLQTCPHHHRPIQLQPIERKLLGRHLHNKLKEIITLPLTQRCLGLNAGTDVAHFTLTQMLSHLRDSKRSVALYFMDVTAAFDSVVHQFLFPCEQGGGEADSFALGLQHLASMSGDDAVQGALSYLREHPNLLVTSGLPPRLRSLLMQWLSGWMIMPHHWARAQRILQPDGDPCRWSPTVIAEFQPGASDENIPTVHTHQ
eukprot:5470950-Amphidinium_carterae.1